MAKREKSNLESMSHRCTISKFKKGEGGVFVAMSQRASAASGIGPNQLAEMAQIKLTRIGPVGEILWNIPSKELATSSRGSITTAPQGRYKISQLLVINKGAKHILSPSTELQSTIFSVHEGCVSNLGEWAIDLKPEQKIRLDAKVSPLSFRAASQRVNADGASILNAYKPDDFPDIEVDDMGQTVIAKVRRTRTVSMLYRIDIAQNNAWGRQLVPALKQRDAAMRSCYTKRLDARPKLKGSVALKFIWVKPTGKLQDIKVAGGDIQDPSMIECLSEELRQIVVIPPTTANGMIRYLFDAKEGTQQQVAVLPPTE